MILYRTVLGLALHYICMQDYHYRAYMWRHQAQICFPAFKQTQKQKVLLGKKEEIYIWESWTEKVKYMRTQQRERERCVCGEVMKGKKEKIFLSEALKFVCVSFFTFSSSSSSSFRGTEKRQFQNMEEAELFLHFSFISIQPSFKFHLKSPYRLSIHPFIHSLYFHFISHNIPTIPIPISIHTYTIQQPSYPSPFSHNVQIQNLNVHPVDRKHPLHLHTMVCLPVSFAMEWKLFNRSYTFYTLLFTMHTLCRF